MLIAVETDAERTDLLEKLFKLLCDLNSMPFFGEIIISIQSVLVKEVEKCNDPESKETLKIAIENLIIHLPDAETKTLFTQTLNKITK